MKHRNVPFARNHVIHRWEFANETAREAAVFGDDFDETDLYKVALQINDKSTWMLIDAGTNGPQWKALGGSGSGGASYDTAVIPELSIDFSVGSEFSRSGWTYGPGHVNASSIANVLDNNTGTVWQSGTGKVVGMTFSLDMLSDKLISRVRVDSTGVSSGDRATLVTLRTSQDGTNWTSHGNYSISTSVNTSDLDLVSPALARYIQLVIVTTNGSGWWTIAELRVYAADVSLIEDSNGLLALTAGQNAVRVLASLPQSADGLSLAIKVPSAETSGSDIVYSASYQTGVLKLTKYDTLSGSLETLHEYTASWVNCGLFDFRFLFFTVDDTFTFLCAKLAGHPPIVVLVNEDFSTAEVGMAALTTNASAELQQVGTDQL